MSTLCKISLLMQQIRYHAYAQPKEDSKSPSYTSPTRPFPPNRHSQHHLLKNPAASTPSSTTSPNLSYYVFKYPTPLPSTQYPIPRPHILQFHLHHSSLFFSPPHPTLPPPNIALLLTTPSSSPAPPLTSPTYLSLTVYSTSRLNSHPSVPHQRILTRGLRFMAIENRMLVRRGG